MGLAFRAFPPSELGNFPYPYQPGRLYTLGERKKSYGFSRVLQSIGDNGEEETFYALAKQGRAVESNWYVEFNHTLPHLGGMRGLV